MATDIGTRPFWQSPPRAQPPTAAPDELDDLFNYDAENDQDAVNGGVVNAPRPAPGGDTVGAGDLGIDEEIKVRKPRAPIAKLDEDRLLSANGIPKLRRISKEKLRFKGKGHEFSDVARLLNVYQLWLDDLFPKAKFADGLSIIEKLGHKKRMQVYRKEWINEGKPRPSVEDASDVDEDFVERTHTAGGQDAGTNSTIEPNSERAGNERSEQQPRAEANNDDDEDLYAEPPSRRTTVEQPTYNDRGADQPEDDELDALLAEDADPISHPPVIPRRQTSTIDAFADEEEAMAGMDFEW